jgi:hypothetical protein
LHFSALEGGLICRDSEPAYTEKRGLPRAARAWLVAGSGPPPGLRPAFEILDYHLTHLLGRALPLSRMYLAACPPRS